MRAPATLLVLAIAGNLAAAYAMRPAALPPPATGAEVVDRALPTVRRIAGYSLWMRMVQDMPEDNLAGRPGLAMASAKLELLAEYLPDFVPLYSYGADLLERWGGPGEAEALLERGIARTNDLWLRIRLGVNTFMYREKDYAAALAQLDEASRIEGHPLFVDRLRAQCLEKLGRTSEAVGVLKEMLATMPDDDIERPFVEKDLERLAGKE